jgi:PilX N-terminal
MAMQTRRPQTGAATLVVVMVLFFIISLVAAYTSRNLIFEQRTSANQYRSTQALEAAEAGLEWAVSMLNFGRIDTSCVGSTDPTNNSFRQRYLTVDPANGKITPVLDSGAPLTPTCVRTPTGWTCGCPTTGTPSLTPPTAAGIWPAFRVRFVAVQELISAPGSPRQPGVIRAEVVGCTRVDAPSCLSFDGLGELNEGRVVVSSLLALTGNPVGLPSAALTAAGGVAATGAVPFLRVYNTAPTGLGFTVHARNSIISTGMDLKTSPGSPVVSSLIENDPALNLPAIGAYTAADRIFATVFNMRPETFRTQQAAVRVTCSSACSATTVRAAIAQNPNQPIWLSGGLDVDSAGDIGSATEPVVIVSNGDLKFSTSGVTIHGLVYNRLAVGATNWVTSGSGTVNGAVVVDGGVSGTGTATLSYDDAVLKRVRGNVGTYVRAPGSWRDFQ